jgi:deoxyribodipyrimidine photo-lyase
MHIFLFHRDLRLIDNTTLIYQIKQTKNITPIFIFPPEQINPKKNKYFSNNSVQFMIESLYELHTAIKDKNGEMYFFEGNNIDVLKAIHEKEIIESIGFNIDYTPYALKRDNEIKEWCLKNKIDIYTQEDYVLYDILDGQTKNQTTHNAYLVFTPFKKYCLQNLNVRPVDKFNSFNFHKVNSLKNIKYNIKDIDKFYKNNPNISCHGGRTNGLQILKKIENWKDYTVKRDFLTYKTTKLGAHNHFSTVSIREVYYKVLDVLGKNNGIINELHWRDFYVNITYYFPHILEGQIKNKNKSFKKKYDKIKWSYNKKMFNAWCTGTTGFPLIDAAMTQLNTTGFMHNRARMCVASFLTKDLLIDWRLGEQYFATKLTDYDPMSNSGGWQWSSSVGTDAQPYYRIFNIWTQAQKYDKNCDYIKFWLPQLKYIPNKDIHNWFLTYDDYLKDNVKYYKPIINHSEQRLKALALYTKIK